MDIEFVLGTIAVVLIIILVCLIVTWNLPLNKEDDNPYVSYEVAEMLKREGFNEVCTAFYHNDKDERYKGFSDKKRMEFNDKGVKNSLCCSFTAAPTLSEAILWLGTERGFWLYSDLYISSSWVYCYPEILYRVRIKTNAEFMLMPSGSGRVTEYKYETEREAFLEGMKIVLNNLAN